MGFLSQDTLKNLEGKYVKFADGVKRELILLSHERLNPDESVGRKYVTDVIKVKDAETDMEKEFNADFGFMAQLAKIGDLEPGDTIVVTPSIRNFTKKDGSPGTGFNYVIVKKRAEF